MEELHKINLPTAVSSQSNAINFVSYQHFGKVLHSAPVVVVLHALSGNSNVSGLKGWWNGLVGPGKAIDTNSLTVLAFNVPGNAYDDQLVDNPYAYRLRTISDWFYYCLDTLGFDSGHAVIGGSLGGCLAWQMAADRPGFFRHVIPVAAHWKASPWVVAQGIVQDSILSNSQRPIKDARMHAMTFYRNPKAFKLKFSEKNDQSESALAYEWLHYHGNTLAKRFALPAYKFMNWLLTTHDITQGNGNIDQVLKRFDGKLHLVAIPSDLLYVDADIKQSYTLAKTLGVNVEYYQLDSDQGHDGFLIEQDKLGALLAPVFNVSNLNQTQYVLSEPAQ